MPWIAYATLYLGGAVLTNAFPHLTAGLMGRPFQSPFADPPGEGLSSSTVNVAWGFLNLALAWFLLVRVADFQLCCLGHVAVAGAGAFSLGLMLARHFGRFHGGNAPLNAH